MDDELGPDVADLSLDDAYLEHGVADLTVEELGELREYVGYADAGDGAGRSASGASAGDGAVRSESAGSSQSAAAGKERRRAEKVAKAKKWMLVSLAEYEDTRRSDRAARYVQEKRVFDTIAFALHYLGDARLSFGGHGQEWLNGLVLEISRLREQRDELLMMDVTLPCLLIVSKLWDLAPPALSMKLFDTCKDLARRVHDRHMSDNVLLKGRARGDLFKIFNNIACLLMQQNEENEAEIWIKDAAAMVRDDEDEADMFLCNSASLVSTINDNFKDAEDLLKRAESVSNEALRARQQAVDMLQEEVKTRKDKLEAMDDAFLSTLPTQGQVFLVRVEGTETKFLDNGGPNLESEIVRLEAQLVTEIELLEKCTLRVMRTCRKQANFYAHKDISSKGPVRANSYGKKLMTVVKGLKEVPLKDDISNALVFGSYYLRWAAKEDRVLKRRSYCNQMLVECQRVIVRVEKSWGYFHTSKRTAELYEKAAIAAMLCRQPAQIVSEWSLESLRLQKIHSEGTVFHARALICLAEGFGYAGDAEQALVSGKDAHAILVELLGPQHMITKRYNKIWVEHKKAMMKGGGRAAAGKMFIARMESKQWIRDWV